MLGRGQWLPGDGGMVDLTRAGQHAPVRADAFTGAHEHGVADDQLGRVDGVLVVARDPGDAAGRQVEQAPHGGLGALRREPLQRPRGREDDDEQRTLAAESFRLLADPTRIKILWALLQGESSVACLAELVGAAPTAVSRHLAKLRLAGLVRGRREGTFVFYSAADEHVRELLAEALRHADHAERGAVRS